MMFLHKYNIHEQVVAYLRLFKQNIKHYNLVTIRCMWYNYTNNELTHITISEMVFICIKYPLKHLSFLVCYFF